MKAGGLAAGVFVAGMVQKSLTTLDPKLTGGGLLAGGLLLSAKAKSPLMAGLGMGIAAKGANSLLTGFGLINGIGAVPLIRGTVQKSVGNVLRNPIGGVKVNGVKDLSAIGALYDN
jgi:hypothetical protein